MSFSPFLYYNINGINKNNKKSEFEDNHSNLIELPENPSEMLSITCLQHDLQVCMHML